MDNLLELKSIQKYYGTRGSITRAVNGISFSVSEGEFIGIMGASGSGKTTLLNCIATIDNVSAGHILLEGVDITELLKGNNTRRQFFGKILDVLSMIS